MSLGQSSSHFGYLADFPVAVGFLEEEMATHSSILAWIIPWTEDSRLHTVHGAAESQTRLQRLSTHVVVLEAASLQSVCSRSGAQPCPTLRLRGL